MGLFDHLVGAGEQGWWDRRSNAEILQADVGRAELRRRAARRAQAASAAGCSEYLNDLKSMTKRVDDAEKCNIVCC